jgi:hypothetical protein
MEISQSRLIDWYASLIYQEIDCAWLVNIIDYHAFRNIRSLCGYKTGKATPKTLHGTGTTM